MSPRTRSQLTEQTILDLRSRFGTQFSQAEAYLEQHSKDESFHSPSEPDAVIFAESTQDVSDCLRICSLHDVPVIPFGAGTSLEGHVTPIYGGISIDLTRMNKVLRVSTDDLDCTVQAGDFRKQLSKQLEPMGLFFPVDPGADATIGGMAATGASGTTTVRYGSMKTLVLGMTVVLPDGRVMETTRRSRKSSAGYDLTHLFIGSEGTLGVITELTLRIFGTPEVISAATVQFPDVKSAILAVIQTIQVGVGVARIELMDHEAVAAVNKYSMLGLPENPLLLLEFHGSPEVVNSELLLASEIMTQFGGLNFQRSTDDPSRRKLWMARHDAALAIKAQRPNGELFITDVCVPISDLAECIVQTQEDVKNTHLYAPIIGHVGDGNFHLIAVIDRTNPIDLKVMNEINRRLISRALSMQGTCTGEHGIGVGKMDFLREEVGEVAISVMCLIKNAIDPQNIMNPGKVIE